MFACVPDVYTISDHQYLFSENIQDLIFFRPEQLYLRRPSFLPSTANKNN